MAPVPPRDRWSRNWDSRPLSRALGMRADDIGEGYARFRVEPVEANADGRGSVHSIAITTAADQCVVTAASTVVDQDREDMNGTAEMNLTYIGTPVGVVTVTGRVVAKRDYLAVIELEAYDEPGNLVARGRSSYAVRPRPPGAGR